MAVNIEDLLEVRLKQEDDFLKVKETLTRIGVASRKDKNFLIIARTDANSVEGLDKTLERIKAYEDAGADMIFPEAMKDESEFEKVRKVANGYLLANMTEFGKSKLLSKKELENLGYNTMMIMTYVSPITSLERNKQRDRSLLPSIVIRSWRDVNKNIDTYKQAFSDNFTIVDLNHEDANKSFVVIH